MVDDNKEVDNCTYNMKCSNVDDMMKPFQLGSCRPVDFQQPD